MFRSTFVPTFALLAALAGCSADAGAEDATDGEVALSATDVRYDPAESINDSEHQSGTRFLVGKRSDVKVILSGQRWEVDTEVSSAKLVYSAPKSLGRGIGLHSVGSTVFFVEVGDLRARSVHHITFSRLDDNFHAESFEVDLRILAVGE